MIGIRNDRGLAEHGDSKRKKSAPYCSRFGAMSTKCIHTGTNVDRKEPLVGYFQTDLTLSDDWLERTLDRSLDFSLTLSDARRQAVSTMSLTSSCISRVKIVCCIWRRCARDYREREARGRERAYWG